MTFDPDAFLAETENTQKTAFDPDSFLEETKGMDPPEPKPIPEPNLEPLKKLKPPKEGAKEATNLLEAFESGYDLSVPGLVIQGERPDVILPENAPMFYRLAHMAGQVIPDIPFMIAGALGGAAVGGAAGTAVAPWVGTTVVGLAGAGFGADALPTAIRETLMAAYDEGSVESFADFWEKAAPVMLETIKRGGIGALTLGVGSKVTKIAAPLAAKGVAGLAASKTAVAASEIGTMTTVGAALDGRVPEPHEFTDAAVLIGGIHLAVGGAKKLRKTYAKTGVAPDQVVKEMETTPSIKEDIVSDNIDIPRALDDTPKNEVKIEGDLGAKSNVLMDESPVKILQEVAETTPPREPPVPSTKTGDGDGVGGGTPPTPPSDKGPILSRIGDDPKKASLDVNESVRVTLDDLDPLRHLDNEAYTQARNYRGVQGLIKHFVEEGTTDFNTGKTVGKPLRKILEPINKEKDAFTEYMVARRAKELHERGIESGFDADAVNSVVEKGGKFEKAFNELQTYQSQVLKYLKDSGIISEKMFSNIQEANKSYVPFYRILEDGPKSRNPGRGMTVHNPVKKIKGSERKIVDPIESIVKNTHLFLQLAERQKVLLKLTDDTNLETGLVEKVKTKTRPIEVTSKEITKFLEEHGIDLELSEGFNIFRPIHKQNLNVDEIAVYRNGKREIYKVPEAIGKAVNALDREAANYLIKMLAKPAGWLRAGATTVPDFIARNVIRDQASAFIFSKNGYLPVFDLVKGATSIWKKDAHFWEWVKSGGMNAHMTAIDQTYISQNVWGIDKKTRFMSKVRNPITSTIEMLRVASELAENATRLGEFRRAREKGKSAKQAAFESREVTLDFARMGAKTQSVNMLVAFWNAHVQGLDRARRAFVDDPVGFTSKVGASITLPSILLWWANHDDPRWKEIPRWQKDLFWIVMTDDHIYRIPKPFELGVIFGSLPERALEAFFTENPKAFDDFGDTMVNAFTPGVLPTFAVPMISHYANKNTFTGFPIIPRAKENLVPELQYSDYTSETSKMIGKLVGLMPGLDDTSFRSPAVIENYINAWSGNMGRYALNLIDETLEKTGLSQVKEKASTPLAQKPVIRAFMIRYPGANAQSIQDFYDAQRESEKIYNSVRAIEKSEGPQAAKEFARENMHELRAHAFLKKTKKALTTMHRMIDKIELLKIPPDEKRQQIDALYFRMIAAAQHANELIEKIKSGKLGLDEGDDE